MSQDPHIRCYDYVNHPFQQVRDALVSDAVSVFQAATKSAAARAESVASELRVKVGGVEVGTDVTIRVTAIDDQQRDGATRSQPSSCLHLEWEASNTPRLFPIMKARLMLYPITATETQLDFSGEYQPPMGAIGAAFNSVIGHRIAEASVHRLVSDVAEYLRGKLGEDEGSPQRQDAAETS